MITALKRRRRDTVINGENNGEAANGSSRSCQRGEVMRMKVSYCLTAMVIVLASGLLAGGQVQAGSKDMVAGKRDKFQDDSVESMREVLEQREEKDKEYREKTLANSEETIGLLKEIRDLLRQLNEKE